MKHLMIQVRGVVQGVFFRKHAQEKAQELGITGYAKNEDDGSVILEVEGEQNQLQQFIEWCHHGPSTADVDQVEIEEGDVQGYDSFSIIR